MVLGGLERPSSGEVRIDAVDIGGLDEDGLARFRRRSDRHRVPVLPPVADDDRPRKCRDPARARRALQMLSMLPRTASTTVGLGHRLAHYPGQLSGGEQQRVAIARAFIAGPKLLLADEPTGNLDAATGDLVIDCLFEQHTRHGTTLLLVTHDPAIAERCGRQVRLMDGRIVEDRASPATGSQPSSAPYEREPRPFIRSGSPDASCAAA